MTDLMAKDLDLALAYAADDRRPPGHDRDGPPDADGGAERRATAGRTSRPWPRSSCRCPERDDACRPLPTPAVILAADHRARGVVTTESYRDYVAALAEALPSCDGILATAQPLADLAAAGHVTPAHRTYLSLNRTGWPVPPSSSTTAWWRRSHGRTPTDGPG